MSVEVGDRPSRVVVDTSPIRAVFNIMPEREVAETFHIQEYRIGHRWIEATFDRTYDSSMEASPSHVTMTVLPLCAQRMGYLYLCHEFGLSLDLAVKEHLKIWPDWLELRYPQLLRTEERLVYSMKFLELEQRSESRYRWQIESKVNGTLELNASGHAILLK